MKLKGINIFERHVEKAFFLLMTLVFAIVMVWQFALGGNTVDVAGQKGVPVDRAFEQVGRIADQKLAQMQQADPDPQVPAETPDAVATVVGSLRYRGPEARLPVPLGLPIAGLPGEADFRPIAAGSTIAVRPVSVPAPDMARAGEYAATLDPLDVGASVGLEPFLPREQPFDLRAVSIAARFNSAALLTGLRSDPDGEAGPLGAIPEPWWRGRIEIIDIEIERREVYGDGTRGESTLVAPAPGRFSLRDRLAGGIAPGDMSQLVADARLNAQDIVQPRFWSVIAGEPWAPPAPAQGEREDSTAEIARLLRQLDQTRREIERAQAALAPGARSALDIFDPRRGVLAQSIGGRGGGGGGSSGPSPEQLEQERLSRQRSAIEARLADLRVRETAISERLTALGVSPEGAARQQAAPELNLPMRIADADELVLWGHDLAIERGARYEYRLRVAVNNPLYGFTVNLAEESREAAEAPVLHSDWSGWSEPVAVDHDSYWFVKSAIEGGRQAVGVVAPTATVEVYRFFYGYWRRDEARVRVGDPIAAAIDLSELALPIFRIDSPGAGATPAVVGQDALTTPLQTATGAMLLDIRPSAAPSGRDRSLGVVIREADGSLVSRRPTFDVASELRKRLEQSAGAGLLASVGTPGAGPVSRLPAPRATDRRDGDRPAEAPSSGDRGIQR